MEEYFEVFATDIWAVFHYLVPFAMHIGLFVVILEILLGVAVLINYKIVPKFICSKIKIFNVLQTVPIQAGQTNLDFVGFRPNLDFIGLKPLEGGTQLAAECPCITRCQCSLELIVGSCGSLPMAVGYSNRSAPMSAIARAHSGNHWSQQIPTPSVAYRVGIGLKPRSPGAK